jgi:hypothetical protein
MQVPDAHHAPVGGVPEPSREENDGAQHRQNDSNDDDRLHMDNPFAVEFFACDGGTRGHVRFAEAPPADFPQMNARGWCHGTASRRGMKVDLVT